MGEPRMSEVNETARRELQHRANHARNQAEFTQMEIKDLEEKLANKKSDWEEYLKVAEGFDAILEGLKEAAK